MRLGHAARLCLMLCMLCVTQVMQMDVLATADGTPVVFHDLNMKRATGTDIDIRQVLLLLSCAHL